MCRLEGSDLILFSNNAETFPVYANCFWNEDEGCRMVIAEVMDGKRP